MSISPERARGLERMVEILYCTETANYIQFRAQRCQKYALHRKKRQIKSSRKSPLQIKLNLKLYIIQIKL